MGIERAAAAADAFGRRAAGLAVQGAGAGGLGAADRIGHGAACAIKAIVGDQSGGCRIHRPGVCIGDLAGTAHHIPDAYVGDLALKFLVGG